MKSTLVLKIFDIILTLIICFVVLIAFLWFVRAFNVFDLPHFVDDLLGYEQTTTEKDKSENELIQLIESQPYFEGEYERVTLSADKATELLSSLVVDIDYFWEVETTVFTDKDSRKQLHRIYKKQDSVRIDTVDEDNDYTTIFKDGVVVTVNNITGENVEFLNDSNISYSGIVNVSAIDKLLTSDAPSVSEIALADYGDEKYLYVSAPKTGVTGEDEYLVSLDCGLVMFASSSLNGKKYFAQNTLTFDTSSVISDKAFDISFSKTAEPLTLR